MAKTKEQLKQEFLKELKHTANLPILLHKNHLWVAECLGVLSYGRFCLVRRESDSGIYIAPRLCLELLELIEENPMNLYWESSDSFHKEMREARTACEAVIHYLENKQKREDEALKANLVMKEEIRSWNKR